MSNPEHSADRAAGQSGEPGRRAVSDSDIRRELQDAIVAGRLPPGTKLSESQLGEIFGVSRTRIRPVLHRLAESRIVDLEPRRGAFVAMPSLAEARVVNHARQIVEEGIVRAVVRRLTPGRVAALRQNVAEETEARLRNDLATAHRLTGAFHLTLAEGAGNTIVVELLRELISRDSLAVALHQEPALRCSLRGHARLIETLERGDEEAAAACMVQHLKEVEASLAAAAAEHEGLTSAPRRTLDAARLGRAGGSGAAAAPQVDA